MPSGTSRHSSRADVKAKPVQQGQGAAFGPLPGLNKPSSANPLNVCVVTSEILGPVKNGGIGTATSALIDNLAGNGHNVTILYTLVQRGEPDCAERNWSYWVNQLAQRNITLTYIPHTGDYNEWLRKSWLVKQHLAAGDYDVVYFNEHHGSGYYALAAKRAGLSPFAERVHCVVTHGSIEWVMNTNDQRIRRAADLQMIGVERRSVEWADVVIGPSQYLLREYQDYGWTLPRHTYRQPYAFPISVKPKDGGRTPVDELVFFGRLETRKGLWLFCEALDRMGEALRGRKVTFMGRASDVAGVPSPVYIMSRAEKWPCQVKLLLDYSQEQALDYLSKPGRVAIMPSLADNSPCVVYECMQQQIPFIATSGSGADELVHTDCWPSVMCEPNAIALTGRLLEVLAKGAAVAWPRFGAEENLATWKAWSDLLADPRAREALFGKPASASTVAGHSSKAKSTFLFIDDGTVLLGSLMDRLLRQMSLYADSGTFALLSARGEPLQGMVADALEASAEQLGSSFTFVAPSVLARFLQSVRKGKGSLIVTDICNELVPAFVTQSCDMVVAGGALAVSCAAASRHSETDEPTIESIPAGDLPAAGGLGMPITSSAWVVSHSAIGDHLSAADFMDPTTGELTPAQDIGQLVFHRLIIDGKPVRLVPEVGTVRTSTLFRPRHERHWYRSSVLHTEALGMKPYLYQDAAAWLAASTFGFRGAHAPEKASTLRLLPEGHPLRSIAHSGTSPEGLAQLAATMGRADQAVQIATAASLDLRSEDLVQKAIAAVRTRPAIDLLALLAGETNPDSATDIVKTLRASTVNLLLQRQGDDLDVELKDTDLADGTATFFDVALFGHESFNLDFQIRDGGPCTIRASVIDQTTGALLGTAEATGDPGTQCKLDVPLHGIHGMFCLIVEIEAATEDLPVLTLSQMQFN
jgi:glycosyltransferase involved in cell wall biosynthesis